MKWQPDGWAVEKRIGVLTPHADVGPESEIRAMAPENIGVHAMRVPFGAMSPGGSMDPTIAHAPVRAFAESADLDQAAETLAAAPLDAIGFGFTSSAYLIGPQGEADMIRRLQEPTRGIPVVATCSAFLEAIRRLRVRKVAQFDPPWFDEALTAAGHAFYTAAGLEVVYSAPCRLPSDQKAITPRGVYDWVTANTSVTAEAVVIGGNGFRAVGAIAALEAQLDRPVLTANQVLFWALLKASGFDTKRISGYGRLFELA